MVPGSSLEIPDWTGRALCSRVPQLLKLALLIHESVLFPPREVSLTYASNHKRDEEPSPGSDHLVNMKERCSREKNDKDNGTGHARVIVIKGE